MENFKLTQDKKKETKRAFIDVINFVNSQPSEQLKLSYDCRLHLDLLVKCWKNEKQLGFSDFNDMKEHHKYITPELDNLIWRTYIDKGHEFRLLYHGLLINYWGSQDSDLSEKIILS
jgi:hypothetical protein